MGAYLSTFASCIPTILYATLLAGQYTTPVIYCEVTASFTNTAPVDGTAAPGVRKRRTSSSGIVHQAGVEMGIAQDEIRRPQFHPQIPISDAGCVAVRHRRLRRICWTRR